MNVQICQSTMQRDDLHGVYPTMGLYTMQPANMCCGPFTAGVVECGKFPMSPGDKWCLVSTPAKGWSFDGTACPVPTMIHEKHIVDCVGMRAIITALCENLTKSVSMSSDTESIERDNIYKEYERRLHTMRWLHVIHLGVVMAGHRWCHLVLATEPLPRSIRTHAVHIAKQAHRLTADGNIAARRLFTDVNAHDGWTHGKPVASRFLPKAVQMTMGGETLQYIGWLSDIVRALVEECTIFVLAEHRTIEHPAKKFAFFLDNMLPDAQRQWLETWEAADRLAGLEDSWTAWVRQCSAIRVAFRSLVYHWEQFNFTVHTYGFERLALFEQARIGGVLRWAMASIERIQLITLYAIAHLTPQLSASDRAAFCLTTSSVLLDICGQ